MSKGSRRRPAAQKQIDWPFPEPVREYNRSFSFCPKCGRELSPGEAPHKILGDPQMRWTCDT